MMKLPRGVEIERRGTILVSEYEVEVRNYLSTALESHGFKVEIAEDGADLLNLLRDSGKPLSAVLMDGAAPHLDGFQMIREIRHHDPHLPIVLLTAVSSRFSAAEAIREGATALLAKPVAHPQFCQTMKEVLGGLWNGADALVTGDNGNGSGGVPYIGWVRETDAFVQKVAWADLPVLILGETGSGKEVLARRLHACSPRAQQPFFKLNCAALPSELVESELFGYERGAFTGAFQKKAGMFELADGGTLLLDEIGDMDPKLQSKLLQVLQDQSFQHLGGRETITVNVRVVAATHRNLESAIADGTFRADLYYRLNVVSISLPPLRERRTEIIPLAEYFLDKYAPDDWPIAPFTTALQDAMLCYPWPGNIRELENFVRRYVVVGDAESLTIELNQKAFDTHHLAPVVAPIGGLTPEPASPSVLSRMKQATEQAETDTILAALNATHWNRKQSASILGIDYKALLYKMKRLSIGSTSRRNVEIRCRSFPTSAKKAGSI